MTFSYAIQFFVVFPNFVTKQWPGLIAYVKRKKEKVGN